ncbi:MAG: hypothetical protein KAZ63_04735 [Vitreoscilla sp.]|nr:hypothetical protein [Vitreoscilla sp.]
MNAMFDKLNDLAGDTPFKRVCSLAAIACAAYPFFWAVGNYYYGRDLQEVFAQAFFFETGSSEYHSPALVVRVGVLALIGRFFGGHILRWISTGKVPQKVALPTLHFKDPEGALEYAAKYLLGRMDAGATLPCLVDEVHSLERGVRVAEVRIATSDGIFEAMAAMPKTVVGDSLKGVLCAVHLGEVVPDAGGMRQAASDHRCRA